MHPTERVYTELNEWFYHDYELTDLGYTERLLSPGLKEVWQLLAIEESRENVPLLMKKCMEYSLFDDGILDFLFPEIGAVIFRSAALNAIGSICSSQNGNDLILDLEKQMLPDNDGPFIFYTPISQVQTHSY